MTEMKFNIGDNPKVSKAIQKRLFKLGYDWHPGNKVTRFTEKPYLYAKGDMSIKWGKDKDSFDRVELQEIDIEWMKQPEKRPTVTVGEKRYYEDELTEALSKIKEIERR